MWGREVNSPDLETA